MSKKNEYDELINYKVQEEDVKKIADIFIFLQKKDKNVQLEHLIYLYKKKIDIDKLISLIKKADEKNIVFPFKEFTETKLIKHDFINFVEGYYYAQNHNVQTTISELEFFASLKINVPELIKAVIILNKYEPELSIADLKNSAAMLYKPVELVQSIIKLKEIDSKTSMANVIRLEYTKHEINRILDYYRTTQRLKHRITIHELIRLNDEGNNIDAIIKAMQTALKAKLDIDLDKIVALDTAGEDVNQLIIQYIKNENIVLRPIHSNMKNGYELIAKVEISVRPDIFNFFEGIDRKTLIAKIEETLITHFSEYEDLNKVSNVLPEISKKALHTIQKIQSSYFVDNISIVDVINGRNFLIERELEQLHAEKEKAEIRASIYEANLRAEKAKNEYSAEHSESKSEKNTSENKKEHH